jgi:ELWxxDGT repeat protein
MLTPLGNGRAVFSADDGVTGDELWVTDGTAAGTSRVVDILGGSRGSNPDAITALGGGRAVFRADDGSTGQELWITDGTAAGTSRLANINTAPILFGSEPSDFVTLDRVVAPPLVAGSDAFLVSSATNVTLSAALMLANDPAGVSVSAVIASTGPAVTFANGTFSFLSGAANFTFTYRIANSSGVGDGLVSVTVVGVSDAADSIGQASLAGPAFLNGKGGADSLRGGNANDTLLGGLGDDVLTGGLGLDRFLVDLGTDVVTDLGLGGSEVLVVSSGATVSATLGASWSVGGGTANGGTATILAQGFGVDLGGALGGSGWLVSNAGVTRAVTLTGSGRTDTLIGGERADVLNGGGFNDSLVGHGGNDTLNGGTGNDTLEGGSGVDRFVVDAGIDTVRDLGAGGFDVLVVSAGAQARATLGGAWLASSAVVNAGVAIIETAGFGVNLGAVTGSGTWSVTNATATGSAITGSARGDTLSGGSGNDVILAREGADVLRGNVGNDRLTGGAGDDTMTGGFGVDQFFVDEGTDTITDLGFGVDALVVSAGATAVATIGANFRVTSQTSNAGEATLSAAGFAVDLTLATGPNGWSVSNGGQARGVSLTGSAQADTLTGGNGADVLRGGDGADVLSGGASNDQLFGGAGNDTLTGGLGADRINVDGGVDVVTDLGAGGADTLVVSAGATVNATLAAAWTATGITANAGVANLAANGFGVNLGLAIGVQGWSVSNAGSAVGVAITGSARADTLAGGAGADTLVGGLGADVLEGGLGADVFRFATTAAAGGDIILDFNAGQGDVLDLSLIDANGVLAGNVGFSFLGGGAFSNVAGQLRFAGGQVLGDVNGDGAADFAITLNGVLTLDGGSILL